MHKIIIAAALLFGLFGNCASAQNIPSGPNPPGGAIGATQYKFSASTFGGYVPNGDCTVIASTGLTTCLKTNGAPFVASAITDATNASNISSGTLALARLALTTNDLYFGVGGLPASTSLSAIFDAVLGSAQGDLLCRGASVWAALTPGTSGQFLETQGAGQNCIWATPASAGASISTNRITTGASNTLASITTSFTTELWISGTASAKTDNVPGCVSGISTDYLIESDAQGTAGTYPLTTIPASGTIGPTGTASYVLTSNYATAVFQCDGAATTWRLVGLTSPGSSTRYSTTSPVTLAAGDNRNVINQNDASAWTASIAQIGSTGFPAGAYMTTIYNQGAGAGTLTPTTSTVNGASSISIPGATGLLLIADNTTSPGNYIGITLGGSGGGTPVVFTGTTAGSANAQTIASPTPSGYALTDQYEVRFKVGAGLANTAASPTLDVNSTTAEPMDVQSGGVLAGLPIGYLQATLQYSATYQAACTCYVVTTVPNGAIVQATTSQSPSSGQWAPVETINLNAASLSVTPVVSTTLSPQGGLLINAINAGTLTATSPDTITTSAGTTSVGGSVTMAAGTVTVVTTDGAGHIYAAGNGGTGGGGNSAVPVNALTDGSMITVPALTGIGALDTVTIAGSHAFANPSSIPSGGLYLTFVVTENGTGGFTPTWGSEYAFPSGAPGFNTAASAVNIVSCSTIDSTHLQCLGPVITSVPAIVVLSSGTTGTLSVLTSLITIWSWTSATSGAKTPNIPACSSVLSGYEIDVKDTVGSAATNAYTITPASGTIDLGSTLVENSNKFAARLTCDGGSNWLVL